MKELFKGVENTGINIKPSHTRMALLSSGGLIFGVWLCFAYRYPAHLSLSAGSLAACVIPFCCSLLSVALLPLVYVAINRFRSNFWGRYHFTLALLAVLSAITCVLLWSDFTYGRAVGIANACIVLPFFSAFTAAFEYTAYSIISRLDGEPKAIGTRFLLFGIGLIVGIALIFLSEFSKEEDAAMGYGLGCLMLTAGLTLYFSSVGYLPRFVRPLQKKVTLFSTIEEVKKRLTKKGVLSFTALISSLAACILALGFLPTVGERFEVGYFGNVAASVTAIAALGSFVLLTLTRRKKTASVAEQTVVGALQERHSRSTLIAGATLSLIGFGAAIGLAYALKDFGVTAYIALLCCFAIVGLGTGFLLQAITENLGSKFGGVDYCTFIAAILLSCGIGFSLAACLTLNGFVFGSTVYGALGVALVACALTTALIGAKKGESKC